MNYKRVTVDNKPAKFILDETEVHLWILRLKNIAAKEYYKEIISEDERIRAGRLKFNEESSKFIQTRGALRTILCKYLNLQPDQVVFRYNKYGKPSLAPSINPRNVLFNLSHSRDMAICAVTRNREVGVDIEYLRDVKRADKIIERFFSDEEREFYRSQPQVKKKLAFFQLWTRKEAYTKAVGEGISLPLDDYTISILSGTPPDKRHPTASNNREWSLYDVEINENYKAALAVKGNIQHIKYFNFDQFL